MDTDVITIDGPSSSGKSTIGFLFAQDIGYQFIDSGIFYRLGSLKVIEDEIPEDDEEKVAHEFSNLKVEFTILEGVQRVYSSGEDVTYRLHSQKVSMLTSKLAAYKSVRHVLKTVQKDTGSRENTVMAGRDIGSEIFPQAKLKFFITASSEIRAQRRFDHLKIKNPELTFEQVLQETEKRDLNDATRENSPMRIPDDAIVIDTTNLTIKEAVNELKKYFRTSQRKSAKKIRVG